MLTRSNPDKAKRLAKLAQANTDTRWQLDRDLAARSMPALIKSKNYEENA